MSVTPKQAAELAKAGDKLAEMLGYTVAAMDGGREFTPKQFAAARRGLAIWYRLRALADE